MADLTHKQIALTLRSLVPGAEFALTGENYNDVFWIGPGPKPTIEEIEAHFPIAEADKIVAKNTERTRINSYKNEPDYIDVINKLKTASASQVNTWVDNNVTNLNEARAVLKTILKVLATILNK